MKMYYRKDLGYQRMLGFWEKETQRVLIRLFALFSLSNRKLVVADVGGSAGYYSLFFAKYLSDKAQIFSFEPSVSILPVLRKNMLVNDISNVKILDLACGDHIGNEEFFIGSRDEQSSLLGEWANNRFDGTKTVVPMVTLDYFFSKFNQRHLPDLIKMDIAGGGIYALKGCDQCLAQKRSFVLIDSHTPDEDAAIRQLLCTHNYDAFRINTGKWVKRKDRGHDDPDGVWGSMLLLPAESAKHFVPA